MNTGNTNREQRINQIATGEFVEYRKRSTRRRPPGAPRRNTASRTAASAYHGQLDEWRLSYVRKEAKKRQGRGGDAVADGVIGARYFADYKGESE